MEPKTTTQFNQFLPRKDKHSDNASALLWDQRIDHREDRPKSWTTEEGRMYTSKGWPIRGSVPQGVHGPWTPPKPSRWTYEYESQSDSDADRPEPDVVLDDLASRRFRSPSPATPTNYAIPMSPLGTRVVARSPRQRVISCHTPQQSLAHLSYGSPSPPLGRVRVEYDKPVLEDFNLRELYEDSDDEDEEGEVGYADPVQDDLYTRRVGLSIQPAKNVPYDKFLPKFWTPEEDAHVRKIKLGSQRRPWYKKMQGFSRKRSGSSSEDSDCDISPWLVRSSPRP